MQLTRTVHRGGVILVIDLLDHTGAIDGALVSLTPRQLAYLLVVASTNEPLEYAEVERRACALLDVEPTVGPSGAQLSLSLLGHKLGPGWFTVGGGCARWQAEAVPLPTLLRDAGPWRLHLLTRALWHDGTPVEAPPQVGWLLLSILVRRESRDELARRAVRALRPERSFPVTEGDLTVLLSRLGLPPVVPEHPERLAVAFDLLDRVVTIDGDPVRLAPALLADLLVVSAAGCWIDLSTLEHTASVLLGREPAASFMTTQERLVALRHKLGRRGATWLPAHKRRVRWSPAPVPRPTLERTLGRWRVNLLRLDVLLDDQPIHGRERVRWLLASILVGRDRVDDLAARFEQVFPNARCGFLAVEAELRERLADRHVALLTANGAFVIGGLADLVDAWLREHIYRHYDRGDRLPHLDALRYKLARLRAVSVRVAAAPPPRPRLTTPGPAPPASDAVSWAEAILIDHLCTLTIGDPMPRLAVVERVLGITVTQAHAAMSRLERTGLVVACARDRTRAVEAHPAGADTSPHPAHDVALRVTLDHWSGQPDDTLLEAAYCAFVEQHAATAPGPWRLG